MISRIAVIALGGGSSSEQNDHSKSLKLNRKNSLTESRVDGMAIHHEDGQSRVDGKGISGSDRSATSTDLTGVPVSSVQAVKEAITQDGSNQPKSPTKVAAAEALASPKKENQSNLGSLEMETIAQKREALARKREEADAAGTSGALAAKPFVPEEEEVLEADPFAVANASAIKGKKKAAPALPGGVVPLAEPTDEELAAAGPQPKAEEFASGSRPVTQKSIRGRANTRTIKKQAGKLMTRLKQLVGNSEDASDLPLYSTVKNGLIEEFGLEFFEFQESFVKSFLSELGMTNFEFSKDSKDISPSMATIGRNGKLKVTGAGASDMYSAGARSATGWFTEITEGGKKRKRYCEMKGFEITLNVKKSKGKVAEVDKIVIDRETSIQSWGYSIFFVQAGRKWQLDAESTEVCQKWYSDLRATYAELCEEISLDAFQEEQNAAAEPEEAAAAAAPPTPAVALGTELEAELSAGKVQALERQSSAKALWQGSAELALSDANANKSTAELAVDKLVKGTVDAPEASPDEEAAAKAAKRAAAKEALAAKRAAARAARAGGADPLALELKTILAYIDALDEDTI